MKRLYFYLLNNCNVILIFCMTRYFIIICQKLVGINRTYSIYEGDISLRVVHCAPHTTAHDKLVLVLLPLRKPLLQIIGEFAVRYNRLSNCALS